MTNLTNTNPLAASIADVLDAGHKLKGAEARFTLSLRDAVCVDTHVNVTADGRVRAIYLAEYFHLTEAEKSAFWAAFAESYLQLDKAKLSKERMNAARSAFVKCARPAIYLAAQGLTDVKVNKDGAFTGVPMGEAIDLLDDTGEMTKAAKAQVEREMENASIEGKTLDEEAAFERVKAKRIATLGKAGAPTATEAMRRWGAGAVALGLVPPPAKRAARTTDGNADAGATFDAAVTKVMEGFGDADNGTDVDLLQPERLKALRNLHAALAAFLA